MSPHRLKPGDNVLVWGASRRPRRFRRAALRRSGRQCDRRHFRRNPSATTCFRSARRASLNRKDFKCWGQLPKVNSARIQRLAPRKRAIRQGDLGNYRQEGCRFRLRASRRATFPVSCLVVKRGGMVVFCAGTTGFNLTFDARYVWMRQKRIQGSHFAHLITGRGRPTVCGRPARGSVHVRSFPLGKIPRAHTKMWKNQHLPGKWPCLSTRPRRVCGLWKT